MFQNTHREWVSIKYLPSTESTYANSQQYQTKKNLLLLTSPPHHHSQTLEKPEASLWARKKERENKDTKHTSSFLSSREEEKL